jgi:hypothetical protein
MTIHDAAVHCYIVTCFTPRMDTNKKIFKKRKILIKIKNISYVFFILCNYCNNISIHSVLVCNNICNNHVTICNNGEVTT